MATKTLTFASFAGGLVRVEYDLNDANWKVGKARVINDSDHPLVATIYQAGARVFVAVAPAQQTTTWNVAGVQLAWQPDYWNDLTETWEPGGIELGDYIFTAQWPGEG